MTVGLVAVALVLYAGVIPGEIAWKLAHVRSGSVEQPLDGAGRSGRSLSGEPAAPTRPR